MFVVLCLNSFYWCKTIKVVYIYTYSRRSTERLQMKKNRTIIVHLRTHSKEKKKQDKGRNSDCLVTLSEIRSDFVHLNKDEGRVKRKMRINKSQMNE